MATKRKHDENGDDFKAPKSKAPRKFDFSKHPKRRIAVQFFYYGWNHDGLVQQVDSENTHLMKALLKTCLIESWEKADVTRCGRTDKGVSAFKQTMALVVRSSDPTHPDVFWEEGTPEDVKNSYVNAQELNYVKMLNGVLPKSIRLFRWAPVEVKFNARFDCTTRTYKYAFPCAGLNLSNMKLAGSYLEGSHDFSNFCQIDMNSQRLEQSYIRTIHSVKLTQRLDRSLDLDVDSRTCDDMDDGFLVSGSDHPRSNYQMAELTIVGSGFLWHMIRYIVTVLHEIGRGMEKPELVKELLDLSKYPSRPHYTLASETPLCLFDCTYSIPEEKWICDRPAMEAVVCNVQKEWAMYSSRGKMLENIINGLMDMNEDCRNSTKGFLEFVQDRPLPPKYVKFSHRPKCETLKEKRDKKAQKSEK